MDNFGGINGPATPTPGPANPNVAPPGQVPASIKDMVQQPTMGTSPDIAAPGVAVPQQSFEPTFDPMAPQPSVAPPMSPEPMQDPMLSVPTQSSGGKLKIVILAVVMVLLLGLAGGGGWYLGYSSGKSAGRQAALAEFQAQAAAQETVEPPVEEDEPAAAELVLGELKDPTYQDQDLKGKVGEQLETNDGLVLMVTNIERNFTVEDSATQLDPAKEYVKVNFLMGNVTKDKPKDLTNVNFRLVNSTGAQLMPATLEDYEGKFDTVKIDPGMQVAGSVVYEVTKGEKPLTFSRSQTYRITNQNREVTMKLSVVVSE